MCKLDWMEYYLTTIRLLLLSLHVILLFIQKIDKMLSTLERRNFGKGFLIHVAVVGCGYTGVELAATLSERLEDRGIVQAINVETTICPAAPPGNREAALKVRFPNSGMQ